MNIKPYLHKNTDKTSGRIMFKIASSSIVNGKPEYIRKYLSIGVTIPITMWDSKKDLVKNGFESSAKINNLILEVKSKLFKIVEVLEFEKKTISAQIVYDIYFNDNYEAESTDFISFALKELHSKRKDYSINHYKDQVNNIENIKLFCKGKLLFSEITVSWLDKYRYYLEHEKKNKVNSIYQKMTTIRKFVNEAIKQNLTTNYAFKNYTIEKEEVDKEFLLKEELATLQDLYLSNQLSEKLNVTLHFFLLSCYTGLRLSDIKSLNKTNIEENWIVLKTQKTSKQVRIPINKHALNLLDFDTEGVRLFYRDLKQSKSRINNDISEILEIAKIKKQNKLTFHCARHTFAINSLILGIPIEVVSKILGHSDLKTTQIYAKVVDSLTNREMDKWNNLFN